VINRIRHLRTLNRFNLRNVWLEGNERKWTLRAAGFSTKLATITVLPGIDQSDVNEFFQAVEALVDIPTPEPRTRRRKKARR
jgi:hypothetical protein